MFQVSGELCLLADVIQRQYLLIRICTGDRADGQDHVELSVTVSVCADVHVDVLIGQRPIAAFRQERIRITARNCSILCVELCSGSAAYRLQKAVSSTFSAFSKPAVVSCWPLTMSYR